MKANTLILVIAGCFLLLSAEDAVGASKRKPKRGKPTPAHVAPVKNGATAAPEAGGARNGGSASEAAALGRTPVRESVKQESRIEFDERMLRGQSAAGVIYLFQRTPSDWKSIVEVPGSFRERTVNVLASSEERK